MNIGDCFQENGPLHLDFAMKILVGDSLAPPMLWREEKGWREVESGTVAPSGVAPSCWVDERAVLQYIDCGYQDEYGETWLLFLRKPTDEEAKSIKWKEKLGLPVNVCGKTSTFTKTGWLESITDGFGYQNGFGKITWYQGYSQPDNDDLHYSEVYPYGNGCDLSDVLYPLTLKGSVKKHDWD